MKERTIIRFSILTFWTLFWGLSVADKIIPDVHHLWVGKDFFALFVKFFGSLGLKEPIFATLALALVSALEVLNFVFYILSIVNFAKGKETLCEKWFFRAIFSSITLFALFSIADQVFGDRFQLLEHGLFLVGLDGIMDLVQKHFRFGRENIFLKNLQRSKDCCGNWDLFYYHKLYFHI